MTLSEVLLIISDILTDDLDEFLFSSCVPLVPFPLPHWYYNPNNIQWTEQFINLPISRIISLLSHPHGRILFSASLNLCYFLKRVKRQSHCVT
jgi:hypothetical protein